MPTAYLPLAIIMAPFQASPQLPPVDVGVASSALGKVHPKIGRNEATFTALNFGRWRDLKTRERVQWLERPVARESTKRTWTAFIRQAKALENDQMVDWVNTQINAIPYVPDNVNWGAADYWATPLEFFERGGDCEDYAIAKYSLLREAGFPVERMKIAVSKNHAVLLVNAGSQWTVLDNRKKNTYGLKASIIRRFSYTINDLEWSLRI